jgi:hypothetical protein
MDAACAALAGPCWGFLCGVCSRWGVGTPISFTQSILNAALCAALCLLLGPAVDLQSKITPSNGKKVTGKDFNAYLAANKVRQLQWRGVVTCVYV